MSFPYNNAQSVSMSYLNIEEAGSTTIAMIQTGAHNMFTTPAPVDVSAMEFAMALEQMSVTGLVRTLASAASTAVFHMADGGPSGDPTTVAVLHAVGDAAAWSNSLTGYFTLNKPADVAGTSATDLDSDDWVNFHVKANATGLVGAAIVTANYIYGKPGTIA